MCSSDLSALSIAEGYARGTGNAALVNLHTGPGLGNAMGNLVTAWHDRTPLVVTAGQQDRRPIDSTMKCQPRAEKIKKTLLGSLHGV